MVSFDAGTITSVSVRTVRLCWSQLNQPQIRHTTETKTSECHCSMLRKNTTKKRKKHYKMKTKTQQAACENWQGQISARTNALAGIMRTSAFFVFMALTAMSAKAATVVDLGSAANFVVLSQAGISTTAGTNIVGDIGVSPIAATAITGFGLILDPSGQFSTSSLVVGKVYAPEYAPPTPSMLGTAIGDMQTA
jgi:hypothetical protein